MFVFNTLVFGILVVIVLFILAELKEMRERAGDRNLDNDRSSPEEVAVTLVCWK